MDYSLSSSLRTSSNISISVFDILCKRYNPPAANTNATHAVVLTSILGSLAKLKDNTKVLFSNLPLKHYLTLIGHSLFYSNNPNNRLIQQLFYQKGNNNG